MILFQQKNRLLIAEFWQETKSKNWVQKTFKIDLFFFRKQSKILEKYEIINCNCVENIKYQNLCEKKYEKILKY